MWEEYGKIWKNMEFVLSAMLLEWQETYFNYVEIIKFQDKCICDTSLESS